MLKAGLAVKRADLKYYAYETLNSWQIFPFSIGDAPCHVPYFLSRDDTI